ncbi:hypothetical protein [Anaerorhabdus sp.]|uniref:hypothetical protein n=1 Tax=Anaerorhabdus sp. TaxID=1872524 RepID=UPI002FC62D44
MEKWGLAVCTLGLLLITLSATSTPANLMMVFSGLFYVVVGVGMIIYKNKKMKKERGM